MAIFENSRYLNQSVYSFKGNYVLSPRQRVSFNPLGFTFVLFKAGDTLDNLAQKYYGNSQLFWAILDANPQYLCEIDISVGDVISIPDPMEVARYGTIR